jgi:hypothetical protein
MLVGARSDGVTLSVTDYSVVVALMIFAFLAASITRKYAGARAQYCDDGSQAASDVGVVVERRPGIVRGI